MAIFCNKLVIFCGVFTLTFISSIVDVNAAYCNSQKKKADAGLYCSALSTHTCPPGCYCTGGGNFTWSVGDVEKGCKERWDKITTELNSKGVFLCPGGKTSKSGAKSVADCFSTTSTETQKCSPGCFCVLDGKIPKTLDTKNICGYSSAYQVSCGEDGVSMAFGRKENGLYTGLIACTRNVPNATYYFDDFSELYQGPTGFYGFVGQDLLTLPTSGQSLNKYGKAGVYQCPVSYPVSDTGAKKLTDCYKYDKNGNKVYFSQKQSTGDNLGYDIVGVDTLMTNLQSASNKIMQLTRKNYNSNTVISLEKDLQNALNKINSIISKF